MSFSVSNPKHQTQSQHTEGTLNNSSIKGLLLGKYRVPFIALNKRPHAFKWDTTDLVLKPLNQLQALAVFLGMNLPSLGKAPGELGSVGQGSKHPQ